MSDSIGKMPSNDETIEAIAASWLVEEEEGFSPAELAEFTRWQNADARHKAAVALLRATCGILGRMPELEINPTRRRELTALKQPTPLSPSPKVARFPISRGLKFAALLAACIAVAFTVHGIRAKSVEFTNTYATTAGGHLRVTLPDQSLLELNADTDVTVEFTAQERRLKLARGEAHFTVAKNPARPFIVAARNVAVRAVGTAFNIRLDSAAIEVLVTEGRVKLGPTTSHDAFSFTPANPPELVAGQSARVEIQHPDAAPQVIHLDSAAMRSALAWQLPRLVFSETPLYEVVEQFNQRNRVQLEIGDAELAVRPVGGTFRADHVETFVSLLEKSGDITVERPSEHRIVLRKAEAQPTR